MIIKPDTKSMKMEPWIALCGNEHTKGEWITLAVTFLVTLEAATPTWARGRLGHRVVSRRAEKQLTP
jgi:hypothetical protein